ncbi:MAG: FAD-dependent oxidoreductase [Burkholderiaceae bacterium]
MRTRDGRSFCCDLVLICTGMAPDTDLARRSGLRIARGILVDDQMMTSDPRIFAAGDVAEHAGRSAGLWAVACEQAEIAAANALGEPSRYRPTAPSTMLKLAGTDYRAWGEIRASAPEDIELSELDESAGQYRKLVIRDGVVVGAILVGHAPLAVTIGRLITGSEPLGQRLAALVAGDWRALEAGAAHGQEEPPHMRAA